MAVPGFTRITRGVGTEERVGVREGNHPEHIPVLSTGGDVSLLSRLHGGTAVGVASANAVGVSLARTIAHKQKKARRYIHPYLPETAGASPLAKKRRIITTWTI